MDEMMSQLDLPSGHKLRILLNSFHQKKRPLFEGSLRMDEMMSQLDLPSGHKLRILLNSFYQNKKPLFEGSFILVETAGFEPATPCM